ncbi:hypothetical protein [Aneurinibacillus tyrosinisolvens]|uniref:hypothetical protein n=1 Tax=Aneurinibacillus tyrosinisolvens TaxID=1443435 RepID=UPI00063F292F|nr:hypothetical protein [Aneurinibacillus tyrosinisolvens]
MKKTMSIIMAASITLGTAITPVLASPTQVYAETALLPKLDAINHNLEIAKGGIDLYQNALDKFEKLKNDDPLVNAAMLSQAYAGYKIAAAKLNKSLEDMLKLPWSTENRKFFIDNYNNSIGGFTGVKLENPLITLRDDEVKEYLSNVTKEKVYKDGFGIPSDKLAGEIAKADVDLAMAKGLGEKLTASFEAVKKHSTRIVDFLLKDGVEETPEQNPLSSPWYREYCN